MMMTKRFRFLSILCLPWGSSSATDHAVTNEQAKAFSQSCSRPNLMHTRHSRRGKKLFHNCLKAISLARQIRMLPYISSVLKETGRPCLTQHGYGVQVNLIGLVTNRWPSCETTICMHGSIQRSIQNSAKELDTGPHTGPWFGQFRVFHAVYARAMWTKVVQYITAVRQQSCLSSSQVA